MLGKSHLFYGTSAGGVLALALAHPPHVWLLAEAAAAGGIGGLLPDLDEPGSTISNAPRILGGMARRLLRRATRRTPLRLLGVLAGLLVGFVAMVLNVVSRTLSSLVRLVAGGHREGSHWLPVWAVLSAVAYTMTAPLLGPWAAVGFCAGYLSHLVGDGCTRAGIPLVPSTAARLHLLPPLLRIRTGSAGETMFTATYIVTLVAVVYVFLA
jgi:LexA-binding, inner membrane-associated putative hydrolase